MSLDIQSMIASVSGQAGIEPAAAETAVGTILSILSHEAPAGQVGQLFGMIDGASGLAQQYDVLTAPAQPGGGLLGAVTGVLGGFMGGRIGALIAGIEQLRATGLSAGQIEQAGQTLLAETKAGGGGTLMHEMVGAVPGLGTHLGV